jgi:hypothetical protein
MPTAWEIQGPRWVLGNFEIADISLSKFCDTQDLQDLRSRSRAEKRDVPWYYVPYVLAHVITPFLPSAQFQ